MTRAVLEITVQITVDAVTAIEGMLGDLQEQHLMVLEDKPSGCAWLTGYYATQGEADTASQALAGWIDPRWLAGELAINELADTDWKESYKEHFKAWQFGRLHWVPVWERPAFQLPEGDAVLWLDPGMAFGTGNHETTRLVVERLVALTARTGAGGRVIDAGCGSGILALSAVLLGYRQVAAFDNDPHAVGISVENAALNDLTGQVEFYVGDLVSGLAGRTVDLLLANIQADVLMRFSESLLVAVAPGGTLVLSGILAQELDQVRTTFAGLAPQWSVDTRILGEWSDLVLTRGPA